MTLPIRTVSPNLFLSAILSIFLGATSIGQNNNADYYVKQINVDDSIAKGVQVKIGNQKAVTMDLRKGAGIKSGTLIKAKSNYTIVYGNKNFNDVVAVSGAKVRLNSTANGENISVCQGKVKVNVKNITGFYYVRDCGGNITLASKSTEYSVDVRKDGYFIKLLKGKHRYIKNNDLH